MLESLIVLQEIKLVEIKMLRDLYKYYGTVGMTHGVYGVHENIFGAGPTSIYAAEYKVHLKYKARNQISSVQPRHPPFSTTLYVYMRFIHSTILICTIFIARHARSLYTYQPIFTSDFSSSTLAGFICLKCEEATGQNDELCMEQVPNLERWVFS